METIDYSLGTPKCAIKLTIQYHNQTVGGGGNGVSLRCQETVSKFSQYMGCHHRIALSCRPCCQFCSKCLSRNGRTIEEATQKFRKQRACFLREAVQKDRP